MPGHWYAAQACSVQDSSPKLGGGMGGGGGSVFGRSLGLVWVGGGAGEGDVHLCEDGRGE